MNAIGVRKVVAGDTVRDAREWLGFTDAQVAAAVGVNRRTVQRWVHGDAAPQPRHERAMERLRELVHRLRTVFRRPAAALGWLHAGEPGLHGRTPASLVQERRIGEVLAVLSVDAGA